MTPVAAVDLGAGSVRVARVDLDDAPPQVEILHRYAHGPIRTADGTLRWDWDRLMAEVITGLEAALAQGPLASIGVDTWGVDYGLLDREGALLSAPYSYRDHRTANFRKVAHRLGEEWLYATTGIQRMPINTLFQLAAHDRDELAAASHLLMLPELVVYTLTGAITAERSSASTTALVDARTQTWSEEILDRLGIDSRLFSEIASAPRAIGTWRGIPVHLVGGHDTASAVVAMPGPPAPGAAFVSSGTWMLVGAERDKADTSEAARVANFANELGALGGVRFLKNVMGLWMVEQCRAVWGKPPIAELLAAAADVPAGGPVVDALDERFLAPENMEHEVRTAAKLPSSAGRDVVFRCVLDSLAATTANVVSELGDHTGTPVTEIHVLGGGAANTLLNRLIETAASVPVRVGSTEATALGNALVQGVALERFRDIDEARAALVAPARSG